MRDSDILQKSKTFALRIIKLYKYLNEQKQEHILSKQLLRCGTSVGANSKEAVYAQSKADFAAKLFVAQKECAETEYWLKLLTISEYITEDMGQSLLNDCTELKRILIASINTAKENKT